MGGFQHGVPWQLHWLAIEQPWSAQAEPFLTLLAQTDSGIRIRKGIEFWRYCLQKCVAKATTVEDQLEAVRGGYNHAPNSAKCNAENFKVVTTIRKRAREEVETVPTIYMDTPIYATLIDILGVYI